MKLPQESYDGDCLLHSVTSSVSDNVADEQTVVQLPPAAEDVNDADENVDYLSLATADLAADHDGSSMMTDMDVGVPANLLDRVLASHAQTYEELLASFMYLTADDVLRGQTQCIQRTANSLPDEHCQLPVSSQTSEFNAERQLILSNVQSTCDIDSEELIEELVLTQAEAPHSEPCPVDFVRQLQVDNFLFTDNGVYDNDVTQDLDFNEFGTLPQYNICDSSFATKGMNIRCTGNECKSTERKAEVDMHDFDGKSLEDFQSSGESDVFIEHVQDAVEPFSLDPDFDYDNIQLSTKFTISDHRI